MVAVRHELPLGDLQHVVPQLQPFRFPPGRRAGPGAIGPLGWGARRPIGFRGEQGARRKHMNLC